MYVAGFSVCPTDEDKVAVVSVDGIISGKSVIFIFIMMLMLNWLIHVSELFIV